jgi:hypothetical protein
MNDKTLFLRWALGASVLFVCVVAMGILGVFGAIIRNDPTWISMTTIAMMMGATAWCGRLTWRLQQDLHSGWSDKLKELRNDAKHGYVVVNLCTLFGFLGTILGMMMMFYAANKGLDAGIGAGGGLGAFKAFMKAVLSGLWPAFITTAVGLICGAIVLLQYHLLDHAITRALLDSGEGDDEPA